VVLLRTPQGEFAAGYGTTRLRSGIRPRTHTYFRIASITKTMTSAVILQLAQEGKLRLGDRISKYVSGVPNGGNITLAELLEMRSGLYDYTSSPEMAGFLDRQPTKVWTPRELLAISFARPPNFPPGTAYEYSNTNYVLLGLVVEKVDRRPLATAMKERLFRPLGMKNIVLPARTSNSIPKPFSHGDEIGPAPMRSSLDYSRSWAPRGTEQVLQPRPSRPSLPVRGRLTNNPG
jgi:D-alanyl-D-alanine carboxypeptidase